MKLKLLFFLLLGLNNLAFAQIDSLSFKKIMQYKWSISIAINSADTQIGNQEKASWGYAKSNFNNFGDITNKSTSFSIIPNFYIDKNTLLRFEFGITNIHLINYYDNNANLTTNNPTTHSIINQSIKQIIYRYVSGIQWNLTRHKFIESYCGIIASYIHYSDMKYIQRFESRDLTNNVLNGGFLDKANAIGGFASGIGAIVGGNLYIQKHVSIGAEFSSSLLYYKIGDTFSGISVDLINPTPSTTQIYSYNTASYDGFQFSKILSSFKISICF